MQEHCCGEKAVAVLFEVLGKEQNRKTELLEKERGKKWKQLGEKELFWEKVVYRNRDNRDNGNRRIELHTENL